MTPAPRAARLQRRRRRRTVAGAALVAVLTGSSTALAMAAGATSSVRAHQANTFDNALIARTALGYVGRWGGQACADAHQDQSGQCKQFVNCIVALASGRKLWPVDAHGDYQASFAKVGGIPVSSAEAVEGDIIQVGAHDGDPVLHTAVVLANHGDGSFTVVDANWVGAPTTPELVGVHEYTLPSGARIWRLGTVASTPDSRPLLPRHGAPAKGTPPAPPAAPGLTATTTALGALASGTTTISAGIDPQAHLAAVRFWLDGHPEATTPATGAATTLQLDTTGLPDGPHHLAAQAITGDGVISPLGADLAITVANTHLVVEAAAPPFAAQDQPPVALTVAAAPAAGLAGYTVGVDGRPGIAQPVTATGTVSLDVSTLTIGSHRLTVAAADGAGRAAAAAPLTITVTAAATGHRATIPSARPGRTDLIAVSTAGHLLRYPWTDDAAFGPAQDLSGDFAGTTILVTGRFTAADGPTQILAVGHDGTARLWSIDASGKLGAATTVTGPKWAGYARLVAGDFTGSGPTRLLGVTAAGHADLMTLAAPGRAATTRAVVITQGTATAAALFAAPETGSHADSLFSIDASGAVSAQHYDTKTGFGAPRGVGSASVPAPGISAVAGSFTAAGPAQILVTGGDGNTLISPAAAGPDDVATPVSALFDQATPPTAPRTTRSAREIVASP